MDQLPPGSSQRVGLSIFHVSCQHITGGNLPQLRRHSQSSLEGFKGFLLRNDFWGPKSFGIFHWRSWNLKASLKKSASIKWDLCHDITVLHLVCNSTEQWIDCPSSFVPVLIELGLFLTVFFYILTRQSFPTPVFLWYPRNSSLAMTLTASWCRQRMRWLGAITDLMDMGLSKLWESVMNRRFWRTAIHGVAKSRTRLSDWTELN